MNTSTWYTNIILFINLAFASISIAHSAPTTITFLQLNDLHAHLTAHADYIKENGQQVIRQRGGLARIATEVNRIRSENPNSILMNIGDTYHGGVEAIFTTGNAIVEPVNALGIDVGVPGNWDFAYGPGVTSARYTDDNSMLAPGLGEILQPNFPNLAANVTHTRPRQRGDYFLPPTFIKTIAGIKVGFIGITSDIVPRMHPLLAQGLNFLQGEAAYYELIMTHSANLKAQGVQLVVVMSELGIHKDKQLADSIPADTVNIFFSAHTHESTSSPIISDSGAWVVEAGNDTFLGRLDVTLDNNTVVNKQWKLIDIKNSIVENSDMAQLVAQARAPFLDPDVDMTQPGSAGNLHLTRPVNTTIGYSPTTFSRRHALQSVFNSAYADMLKDYAGTQIAMTSGFRFDSVIPGEDNVYEDPAIIIGSVTIEDAYRFFPMAFSLSTGQTTGATLKSIIENNLKAVFSPDAFNHGGGWFDGYSGIDLTVNLASSDNVRVEAFNHADGSPILDNEILNVGGCTRPWDQDSDTTLCSYSGFNNVTALINPATGEAWYGVDFLIYGLENNLFNAGNVTPYIHDTSNTLMWPEGSFYQPINGVQ